MGKPADALVRWWGMFCLLVAGGMLIWGLTVLRPHLRGWGFVAYWFVCFGFTVGAMGFALLDLWVIRLRTREEHRRLVQRTLEDVETEGPAEAETPGRDGEEATPRRRE